MPDLVGLFSNIDFLSAVFFILGFIMIIIEMFHPGFGAPGISGIILLILGIVSVARNLPM